MPRNSYTGANSNDTKWVDIIQPYLKSTQIYSCPSDSGNYADYRAPADRTTNNEFGSYAMNNYYYLAGAPTPPSEQPLSAIASTAETVLITEVNQQDTNPTVFWRENNTNASLTTTNGQRVIRNKNLSTTFTWGTVERHLETTCVAFVDGHVKSLKLDALLQRGSTTAYSGGEAGGNYRLFTIEDD